jgi:hypothetical protein
MIMETKNKTLLNPEGVKYHITPSGFFRFFSLHLTVITPPLGVFTAKTFLWI